MNKTTEIVRGRNVDGPDVRRELPQSNGMSDKDA